MLYISVAFYFACIVLCVLFYINGLIVYVQYIKSMLLINDLYMKYDKTSLRGISDNVLFICSIIYLSFIAIWCFNHIKDTFVSY